MAMVIVKILITLFAVSATLINSLAIFIYTSNRNLREDVTARLMVSSAVGDLGSSLFTIGLTAIIAWNDFNFPLPWLAGFQGISLRMFTLSSSTHLCLIAVVKCIVICRPFTHRDILSDLKVGLALAFVWIYSILFGCIVVDVGQIYFFTDIVFPRFDPDTYLAPTTEGSDLQTLIHMLQFVSALLSIVISYGIIFGTILKHRRQISTVNQPTENANMARDFLKSVRSAKNMFIITLVYFLAYAPTLIGYGLGAGMETSLQFIWIMMLHTMTSSLLYMSLHTEVRDAVKKKFRKWWNRMFGRNDIQTATENNPDNR